MVDFVAKPHYIKRQMGFDCAFRYRFYPTPKQADLLNKTFGCVRFVYNRARAVREESWKERKESFGYTKTSSMLTKLKKDPELVWLNEISCVPLQQGLRHLDDAYRNFFRKTARYPKFRKKDGKQSAEFTRSGFSYRDGALKLAKMDEPLNVVWSRDLPTAPTTVIVSREPDGCWYVSCRIIKPTVALTGGGAVGIDLGLADLAILSSGNKFENPRHFRKGERKLAKLQRRLSRKTKGSKNRAKSRLKVARAHTAIRNARRDHLQKLSTQLVRKNHTICVENLSIKGIARTNMAKSIGDAAWGEFVRMLSYKSVWYGRTLVKIDRFYPSTKTCSCCGTTGHVLPLSVREWDCPDCGAHHDRDGNAAKNILAAGLAVLACRENINPYVAAAA